MKTTTTITLLLASTTLSVAQVANGGFEDWTNQFVYEELEEWRTGNSFFQPYTQTTKVTTNVPDGNFAVRIETEANANDTLFGFVLFGDLDDDTATAGVPFTTEISYLSADLRYDIQPNDTALIIFAAWSGGNIVSVEEVLITGTQNTWMPWTYFLSNPVSIVDSVLFAAASSNPDSGFPMHDGSWMEIDNVQLLAPGVIMPDLLPNHSFEDWFDVEVEDPDDWNTYNYFTAGFATPTVVKSNDAFMGSYSAQVSTVDRDGDAVPGVLSNGSLTNGLPAGGVPYTSLPTMFTGAYKYIPVAGDTGYISVLFYDNGMVTGVNGLELTAAATTWTPFNLNLVLGTVPDTMLMVAFSGENVGSTLWVDDLDLSGGTVGVDHLEQDEVRLFPSPASHELFVAVDRGVQAGDVRVIDLNGRTIPTEVTRNDGLLHLPIRHLSNGTYVLELTGKSGVTGHRFVKDSY